MLTYILYEPPMFVAVNIWLVLLIGFYYIFTADISKSVRKSAHENQIQNYS